MRLKSIIKIVKRNSILRYYSYTIRRIIYHACLSINAIFYNVDKNKVLFSNFHGKGFGCNPRAIAEELHKRRPELDLVWLCEDSDVKRSLPSYVRPVKPETLSYFYEISTSGTWVYNVQIASGMVKRKGQMYIQTSHGDRTPKKVYYLNVGKKESDHKHAVTNDILDYGIVGSVSGESVFREAMGYKGKLLQFGCPRNDCLINKSAERVSLIRRQLNIPEDTKLLLYAPTFRQGKEQLKCELQIDKVLDVLERKTSKKWICLLRSHFHTETLEIDKINETRYVNVSKFPDMADLLLISDMLITDYSSSSGDFCLTGKPIVLFIDEKETYSRSLLFDIDETPYMVAHNQKELESIVSELDAEKARKNDEELIQFWGIYETGYSSSKVVDVIISHIDSAN